MESTRVFVYGSLLKGLHNHRLLVKSHFVKQASTRDTAYLLVDNGRSTFPYALAAPGDASEPAVALLGELYEVDAQTLKRLDQLEGHPSFYRRREVELVGEEKRAWVYLLQRESLYDEIVHSPAEYARVPNGDWRTYLQAPGETARVFVYGSLLKGLHNHRLLESSNFIKRASTRDTAYLLVDSGNTYPFALAAPDGGQTAEPPVALLGELYEVDMPTLRSLDELEGHPYIYRRHEVALEGESECAWLYLLHEPELLEDVLSSPATYNRVPTGDWRAYLEPPAPEPPAGPKAEEEPPSFIDSTYTSKVEYEHWLKERQE